MVGVQHQPVRPAVLGSQPGRGEKQINRYYFDLMLVMSRLYMQILSYFLSLFCVLFSSSLFHDGHF